jgi:hypothetical protein
MPISRKWPSGGIRDAVRRAGRESKKPAIQFDFEFLVLSL